MSTANMKNCAQCKKNKPLTAFYKHKGGKYDRSGQCKNCLNSDKRLEHRKNTYLIREYGISLTNLKQMILDQNGLCAICFLPETEVHTRTGKIQSLSVDHCHLTGKIRGLLCTKCNKALGLFNDEKQLLLNTITYLEKTNV